MPEVTRKFVRPFDLHNKVSKRHSISCSAQGCIEVVPAQDYDAVVERLTALEIEHQLLTKEYSVLIDKVTRCIQCGEKIGDLHNRSCPWAGGALLIVEEGDCEPKFKRWWQFWKWRMR